MPRPTGLASSAAAAAASSAVTPPHTLGFPDRASSTSIALRSASDTADSGDRSLGLCARARARVRVRVRVCECACVCVRVRVSCACERGAQHAAGGGRFFRRRRSRSVSPWWRRRWRRRPTCLAPHALQQPLQLRGERRGQVRPQLRLQQAGHDLRVVEDSGAVPVVCFVCFVRMEIEPARQEGEKKKMCNSTPQREHTNLHATHKTYCRRTIIIRIKKIQTTNLINVFLSYVIIIYN